MIERYLHKEIAKIWEEETKYRYFLQVELVLLKHLEAQGRIPSGCLEHFQEAKVNLDRVHEIEKTTHHDVVAFCESITEQVDPTFAKYFHYGVTSSDIIDTALSLQIRDSLSLVCSELDKVLDSLKTVIEKTENTLGLGRSHGVYAEPMIFAAKFLSSYAEFNRRLKELKAVKLTGQISGAVGNYSLLTPKLENLILDELNLETEEASTQVIPRDHLAKLTHTFSLIACAIERLAMEVRHLHHEDINEAQEGFSEGQKGSSTMPHKKNPIATENLTGIARVIRSYVTIAEQNCFLWHERDISHSSAERVYLADMFGYTAYALKRMSSTIANLNFNTTNIEKKVLENPKIFSSIILHKLISEANLSREEAYKEVQECTFDDDPINQFKNLFSKYNIEFEFEDINSTRKFYQKNFDEKKLRVLGREE